MLSTTGRKAVAIVVLFKVIADHSSLALGLLLQLW